MADEEGGNNAAQAFEELRAEVTLMRRAVERLTAERMEVPEPIDYSETLGKLTKLAAATFQKVDAVAASPALAMTPDQMAGRIAGAASTVRQEDRQTIATARTSLEEVTRKLHGYVVSARRGDEQNRWLAYAGLGGTVLGMILWATCAGPIAHLAPANWRWPEKMAARTLDLPMWEAGRHLLIIDSPESWNALADSWNLVQGNSKAIDGCRKAAAKARETVRCTISIKPMKR